MKILQVNTFDRGGAANSCFRLHKTLVKKGVDSNVLLKLKSNVWPNSFAFHPLPKKLSTLDKLRNKIKRLGIEFKIYTPIQQDENSEFLKTRPEGLEMFSFPKSGIDITQSPHYKEADIINLHWVANFIDFETFFRTNQKPVVWTLHDMNPFTGGEHYSESFLGMDENGNPIPRKVSKEEREIESVNLQLKKEALAQVKDLTIVAPSNWMAKEARKSELFKRRTIHVIPYGLDSQIFTVRDKNFSREVFGIPWDKKVFLFVADSMSNNRKGFQFLQEALRKIENKDIILCAIGNNHEPYDAFDNILELGAINDERLMSMAYSAADVFVIPSLMDNLPNTVLESLMCGTPVIGFPAGGIPEMIDSGVNGFLTEEISVNSLKEALEKFLVKPERFDARKIRTEALKKYDEKIQAEKYIQLFKQILKE